MKGLPIKAWNQITRGNLIYDGTEKHVLVHECKINVSGKNINAVVKQYDLLKPIAASLNDEDRSVCNQARYMATMRNNDNFLKLFGSFFDTNNGKHRYTLVMELAGKSLDKIIIDWENQNKSKSFKETEAYKAAKILIKAMRELNLNCIQHRDIKPANILIGDRNTFKIIDFDISEESQRNSEHVTMTQQNPNFSCTRNYAAPEFIKFLKNPYQRGAPKLLYNKCDVFSLGLTVFRMVSNQHEGQLNVGISIQAGIDRTLDEVIETPKLKALLHEMLLESPERRPKFAELYERICKAEGTY